MKVIVVNQYVYCENVIKMESKIVTGSSKTYRLYRNYPWQKWRYLTDDPFYAKKGDLFDIGVKVTPGETQKIYNTSPRELVQLVSVYEFSRPK